MRIHLRTSKSHQHVPFNYQPNLTGALHKWLGINREHDKLSLYSFSWLQNGETSKNGICFPLGANFFISSPKEGFIKAIIEGIRKNPEVAFGLRVEEVVIQENPVFKSTHKFHLASPIFIKRLVNNETVHYTFQDQDSSSLMTETLQRKLRQADLNDHSVSVCFDTSYLNPKTKLIHYNQIANKVNLCPVVVSGTPEQLAFAWNVGLGNSTGIGFGALK
jgi:CRISPR-associated endoribonuclease Cas6